MTDRTTALAEALHNIPPVPMIPHSICRSDHSAAAILAALPPDWCGHGPATREQRDLDDKPFCPTGSAQRYHDIGECDCIERETPPCPFCGHREHRDDTCEQDLGEHGECQCADTRPRSDSDIVRAAYDRLDAANIVLNDQLQAASQELARLRKIEEAARAVADKAWRRAGEETATVPLALLMMLADAVDDADADR